jgi:hypothetical protein
MGFELFIHSFDGDEPAKYDRRIVEDIFSRDAINPRIPLQGVTYADGQGEIYGAEDDLTSGIMMAHFSGRTIVERAFELAAATKALIFWPGDEIWMAVTSRDVISHLPEEADRKRIAVVRNVDELIAVIGLV